jgi:hypothetical protein
MSNITEEGEAFAEMLRKAAELDKTKQVKPQECSLDNEDCEACGS